MKHSLTVMELVGPAGAGKSTLTEALRRHDEKIRVGAFPDLRQVKNSPFFVWNALLLMPTFYALYGKRTNAALSFQQMALMTILNGWHRQLRHSSSSPQQGIVVLDQGPVYLLAELLRFGPQNFREIAKKWWERTCRDWANTLNMVICLDAPDVILMERIRARGKDHGIKENSDEWSIQFLSRYREAQREVLTAMSGQARAPKIICIDSSRALLNETVEKITTLLAS